MLYVGRSVGPEDPPAFVQEYALESVRLWDFEEVQSDLPLVIFFNPNAGTMGGAIESEVISFLREHAKLISFDYPGYGNSPKLKSSEKSLVRAGEEVLRWAQEKYPDKELYLFGHSLGAAVALQVAKQHQDKLKALILVSAWSSLKAVVEHHFSSVFAALIGASKLKDQYDSKEVVQDIRLPVLLTHGTDDKIVPFAQGLELKSSVKSPVWVPVEGGTHNDIYSNFGLWRDFWVEVESFLKL